MSVFTALRHIAAYLAPYRGRAVLLILTLIIDVSFDTALPLSLKFLIDRAIVPRDATMLLFVVGGLFGGYLITACSQICRDYLYAWLGSHVLGDLREEIYGHVQRLSPAYFARTSSADLMARFSSDLSAVESAIVLGMPGAIISVLHILVSTTVLVVLDWHLALIVLLGLPLCLIGPRILGPKAAAVGYRLRNDQAALSAAVQESVAAQAVVRAFTLQEALRAAFKSQSQRMTALATRFNFLSYFTERSPNLSMQLFSLGVIGGGGWLAFQGLFSIGDLVSFNALYVNVSASVLGLTSIAPTLLQATGGMQRIREVMDESPEVVNAVGATVLPPARDHIAFDALSFGYTLEQRNLDKVSYRIPIGAKVAFVGHSGSGKSTNLNLILRFYDPDHGRVLIDGHDLRQVSLESLYDQMGVVFQESFLFNTSIRENIRMGRPGASDVEVEVAARAAELHDIVIKLPAGYDTPVGERGGLLSGGQRQRVAIARALIRNPGIVVLDEATSALDPATEAAINQTLERVSSGRTVLSVTHRLQAITGYDLILVFDHGRLIEQGPHSALLAQNGTYASLWKRQSGLRLSEDGRAAHIEPDGLKEIPLFKDLDLPDLAKIVDLFATEHVAEGQKVIVQGQPGEKFFILIRGKVAVDVAVHGRAPARVATLADGDFFGEMSLLANIPTTATVTTLQPTILLTLRCEHFNNFLHRHSQVRTAIEDSAKLRHNAQTQLNAQTRLADTVHT
ncbi:MAG: ATP-binding cassette domain-containing protein [Rhodopila sp.]